MPRTKGTKNIKGIRETKILRAWMGNSDWSAQRFHKYLIANLKTIKLKRSEVPSPRALSSLKNRNADKFKKIASNKANRPWSLLAFGDIQPQALPIVMKLQKASEQINGTALTFLEAKWASRLSSLYKERDRHSLWKLFSLIQDYAWAEQMNVAGFPEDDFRVYKELTGKGPKERIFDEFHRELESEAMQLINQGLRNLQGKSKKEASQ
jgi:hypothetical protein